MSVFDQEQMLRVCEELGIEVIEGNVSMMNDKPVRVEDKIFKNDKVTIFNGVEMPRMVYEELFNKEYVDRKGKIISFEGTDGCFKETNSKRLYEYLKDLGIKVNLVSFPRYDDDSSIFIKRYLNGEYDSEYNNKVGIVPTAYMYALDRYDYIVRNKVRERVEEGEWFIFDRYVESNVIYESARIIYNNKISARSLEVSHGVFDDILNFEYIQLALPKPDILIALFSDYDLTMELLSKRETTDKNESDKEFMMYVFATYDILINVYNWNRINVFEYIEEKEKYQFKSKDQIFNEILDLLRDRKILL